MLGLTDCCNITIAVDWNVKQQTKGPVQRIQILLDIYY